MEHPAFIKMQQLAREPEALEATICYLTEKLEFLKKGDKVLICFQDHEENSIGFLMEQAVIRCGAVPVLWGEDLRWKTLLRLAFSSRAGTVIGPPLIVLGLTKLARYNATPLYIRNVVTAGYPCLDWMIDGIISGLDCDTWGCFGPGMGPVVGGFSCGKSRGVHLRDDVYGMEILGPDGTAVSDGRVGDMVMYLKADPAVRYPLGERARIEYDPCPCGCSGTRLQDMGPGFSTDRDLRDLGQQLQSWNSVLDCRLRKGDYGLEMEIVVFPGEKLPALPSCARLLVRSWQPETDKPFWYVPAIENSGFLEEQH